MVLFDMWFVVVVWSLLVLSVKCAWCLCGVDMCGCAVVIVLLLMIMCLMYGVWGV